MTNVLVIAPDAHDYVEHLRTRFPAISVSGSARHDQVEDQLAAAEVLITSGIDPSGMFLDPGFIRRMPRLRWMAGIMAGYEHMEKSLAERPDVMLTSGVGIHGPQVSEIVLLAMLGINRRVKRIVDNQASHRWELVVGDILDGRSVGIVGLGPIGARVARVCQAFGMEVHGLSRSERYRDAVDQLYAPSDLRTMAARVDFLVLTLPHTPETDRLIDADVLRVMKPTACLINVARGGVVDEPALIEALQDGTIAAAGLDVFAQEPLPADSPLWDMPNVFLTTHVAGFHTRYTCQVLDLITPNMERYLNGSGEMVNVVGR